MEAIIKIIGIGLISVILLVILKQYKKEFAIYISLIAGAIIIFLVLGKLAGIVEIIEEVATKTSINMDFVKLLIKITGIAILIEFAVSICKDAGESAIANKVDFGGKIVIISMSIPIITNMLDIVIKILP